MVCRISCTTELKLHKCKLSLSRVKKLLVLQLSNEMQLSIMNKVKSGELSIEDALNQARKDRQQLLSLKNQNDEVRGSLKNVVLFNSRLASPRACK